MTHSTSFATAIGCIDGRIQKTLGDWVRDIAGVEYVDTITWPGANGALAEGDVGGIRQAVELSASAHGSRLVVVAGHHDCASHPGTEEEHRQIVGKAVERVRSWDLQVEVIGAWIGPDWKTERV